MTIPRLHIVTDDVVLRGDRFIETAGRIMRAFPDDVALQLRGHGLAGRELYDLAHALVRLAGSGPRRLLVNDRTDVAAMVGAAGVQLGRRSLPVATARRLLGPGALIGFSAHDRDEALSAAGADFLVAGAVYPTASHPGRPAAGPRVIKEVAAAADLPVIAIGGIMPGHVHAVVAAGAYGVAVLGGIWRAVDPLSAAGEYVDALDQVRGSARGGQGTSRERGA